MNIFEPWVRAVDMTDSDIGRNDHKDKLEKLYPYEVKRTSFKTDREYQSEILRIYKAEIYALSFEGTKKRIQIIDSLILKGLRV
jgi:hypothetical protein